MAALNIGESTYKRQHPIPQNVMQVEFKLIGNLTIRQFVYAAVGIVVFYIIITSPIPSLFKVPLGFISLIGGLAIAFLPLEDRGLDQWLRNFLSAIFTPTQRVWRKDAAPPDYFLSEYTGIVRAEAMAVAPPTARSRLAEYLSTAEAGRESAPLDKAEEAFFRRLNLETKLTPGGAPTPLPEEEAKEVAPAAEPQGPPEPAPTPAAKESTPEEKPAPPPPSPPPPPKEEPESPLPSKQELTIKTGGREEDIPLYQNTQVGRKLLEVPVEGHLDIKAPPSAQLRRDQPKPLPTSDSVLWARLEDLKKTMAQVRAEQAKNQQKLAQKAAQGEETSSLEQTLTQLNAQNQHLTEELGRLRQEMEGFKKGPEDEALRAELAQAQAALIKLKKSQAPLPTQVKPVPKPQPASAKPKPPVNPVPTQKSPPPAPTPPQPVEEEARKEPVRPKNNPPPVKLTSRPANQEAQPAKRAEPPKEATPSKEPLPPLGNQKVPNLISGIIKDKQGKLVVGAVVIIKDEGGDPVRALKTNSLGQFVISTPLPNGSYNIEVKARGKNFAIIKTVLTGGIVSPVEVRERG